MNLHSIAGPIVAAVNPTVTATLKVSTGYSTAADGTQVPSYAAPVNVQAQIQALTWKDLQQIAGLNLNGVRRAIYLYGDIEGVNREAAKGGDLITFPDGTVWLVAQQIEAWPGWCKCGCTLQNDA